MADPLDLDHAAALSDEAPRGEFLVDHSDHAGDLPLVADFGIDETRYPGPGKRGHLRSVIVAINGGRSGSGAAAEADLVAWMLTNRDELIRLARIGQEHDRE